jgi:sulfite exporter TauE/SafE/copper chaperone CopZ
MADKISTVMIRVEGMTCGQCEQRIEKAVGALTGVLRVEASAGTGEVRVSYDAGRAALGSMYEAIRRAGYQVVGRSAEAAAPAPAKKTSGASIYRFLGLIAVVAAVYLIIRYTVGFTFLPAVSQSMGYGLIFVVGLLTSLHCVAMCGGIVLSQGVKKQEEEGDPQAVASQASASRAMGARPPQFYSRLVPSLLYNGGRVISYTIVGGIVGALGSLFSLSTSLKGAMPILAGVFMLFLGLRMLGIFPWLSRLKIRLPGIAGRKFSAAAAGRGPFVVGLLSALMPCGPLQTMQVYALGTGSLFAGALSMFLFSLGTVPLLLGFGLVSSLLSAKFNTRMLKASGVLVLVLGLVMFTRGISLFGVALPPLRPAAASDAGIAVAKLVDGGQEVRTTVESGRYYPLIVQAGVPVRWTLSVKADDLNGCNNPVTIPQYGIRKQLVPGDNLIEFTPSQAGTIGYTCWMGMISSYIKVIPDLTRIAAADLKPLAPDDLASALGPGSGAKPGAPAGGGCCGATPGRFAGGKIPVDAIQLARFAGEGQEAEVVVNDQGYTPAVLVVQKGVKAKIRFVAEKLTSCNYLVYFPEYQGGLDLSKGRLETPYLEVSEDFTFECGMSMLHGYVKVVEDITLVDLNAVRRQIAAFKPAATGAKPGVPASGCCGQ